MAVLCQWPFCTSFLRILVEVPSATLYLAIFSKSVFNSLVTVEYENKYVVPELGLRERLYQMLFEGIHVAMFCCHPFCTASACPSIWMNIFLKGPVIRKLPVPARGYGTGLNWAWVIQTLSEVGFIIPPHAAAVNISEGMPLVVEQVISVI